MRELIGNTTTDYLTEALKPNMRETALQHINNS